MREILNVLACGLNLNFLHPKGVILKWVNLGLPFKPYIPVGRTKLGVPITLNY